jgi:hypothetical protein
MVNELLSPGDLFRLEGSSQNWNIVKEHLIEFFKGNPNFFITPKSAGGEHLTADQITVRCLDERINGATEIFIVTANDTKIETATHQNNEISLQLSHPKSPNILQNNSTITLKHGKQGIVICGRFPYRMKYFLKKSKEEFENYAFDIQRGFGKHPTLPYQDCFGMGKVPEFGTEVKYDFQQIPGIVLCDFDLDIHAPFSHEAKNEDDKATVLHEFSGFVVVH